MPRYFFNINDQRDSEGTELSDVAVAKCHAIKVAGRVICDEHSDTFWDVAEWTMTVTNAAGLSLFQLLMIGTDGATLKALLPSR